jgi:hypothetical protein
VGALIAITFLVLLLVLVAGTAVWLFDLEGRRKPETGAIERRVAAAVQQSLGDVAVIPVAYVSRSRRIPDVVEMHGRVPSVDLRAAVLRVAGEELARSWPGCRLADRLAIVAETDLRVAS